MIEGGGIDGDRRAARPRGASSRAPDARRRAAPPSRRARRHRLYLSLALIDSFALTLGFGLAGLARLTVPISDGRSLAAMVVPVFLLFAFNNRAYGYSTLADWRVGLRRAVSALAQALALVVFAAFYLGASADFSRLVFGLGGAIGAGLLVGGRVLFKRHVDRVMGGNLRGEMVIVDGVAIEPIAGVQMLDAAAAGLEPDARDPMMRDRLGTAVRDADYVLVCCPPARRGAWAALLKGTDVHSSVLAPEFDQVGASRLGRFHGHPTIEVSTGVLDLRARALKRLSDVAITVPLIVLLTPLLLAVALAIKLDSRGPVLFRQQRLGRGNRLFELYKFRSMRHELSDAAGNRSAARDDDRVTRVGRFIRATSIDELPQLFNVLVGDMSLVGPRPHALGSLAGMEPFWDVDPRYWNRHALKPGITGLAQVRGQRGATPERGDLLARLQSDLEYFENWSLWRDVTILAATLKVVVHRNAY